MAIRNNLSFNESLDTVRQSSDNIKEEKRVKSLFQLSTLFSEQIILSDTQFVDNRGFRTLFLYNIDKKGFLDFLNEVVIVGTRPNFSSFNELVDQQIKARMKFSSFPYDPQRAIEDGEIKNVSHLDALYPKLQFKVFIDYLDKIYDDYLNNIDIKFESLPPLVEKNLKLVEMSQDLYAKKLGNELMSRTKEEVKLKKKEKIDRSDFYSAIDKSPYNSKSKDIVKRFCVDYAYNKNFWDTNKLNNLNQPSEKETALFKDAFPNITKEMERSKDIIKLPPIPSEVGLHLDEIDFDFLYNLHSNHKRELEKLSQIRTTKNPEVAKLIFENYLNILTQELKDLYIRKGLRRYIKPVEIVARGGTATAFLANGMNYLTPEISFVIGAPSVTVLFLTGLIDRTVLSPRQNTRFIEVKEYIDKIELENKNDT